jgi:hypothetical protein
MQLEADADGMTSWRARRARKVWRADCEVVCRWSWYASPRAEPFALAAKAMVAFALFAHPSLPTKTCPTYPARLERYPCLRPSARPKRALRSFVCLLRQKVIVTSFETAPAVLPCPFPCPPTTMTLLCLRAS